jgi:hypothetical protein
MTRKLKLLGMTALAVVAVGSIGAAAAQAAQFTASQYPATLTGEATSTHVITFGGGPKIECQTVSQSGKLEGASETFGIALGTEKCSQNIGGIKYESGTTFACSGIYTHLNTPLGTQKNCTSGYTHDWETYFGTTKTCVYSMEDLGSYEGVKHENLGGTSGVAFTYNLTGIPYKLTTGSTLLCGPASSTATYTGSSVYKAKNEKGEAISFDIG